MKSFDYSATTRVLREVVGERARQHAIWGEQNHDDGFWFRVILEEFGECSEASLHDQFGGKKAGTLRTELLHLAASAVQYVEYLDRNPPRGFASPAVADALFGVAPVPQTVKTYTSQSAPFHPPAPETIWEMIAARIGRYSCSCVEFNTAIKEIYPLADRVRIWNALLCLPFIVRSRSTYDPSAEIRDVRHCARFPSEDPTPPAVDRSFSEILAKINAPADGQTTSDQ